MKVFTKQDMEEFYRAPDPFHYRNDPEDQKRKLFTVNILDTVAMHYAVPHRLFRAALDIGCGEGWITMDLPAINKFGYEQSELARSRFPSNVKPVLIPDQTYELVVANGVLYHHYDWRMVMGLIRKHARQIVLTGHLAHDEVAEAIEKFPGTQILQLKFPYKEWTWKIRVFDVTVKGH